MKNHFTFIMLCISVTALGQPSQIDTTQKAPLMVIPSPGISYHKQYFVELNIMFSKISESSCNGGVVCGPRIGFESNLSGSNLIIAPKIGYEYSALLFCMRGNAVYYLKNNEADLRLLPEFGISLNGAANLTYGFAFPLLKNKFTEVNNSRITLTINLNKELFAHAL